MPVSLIIFDLDGTLVDTLDDISASLNHALKPCGLRPLSTDEVRSMVGEGLSVLLQKALGPDNISKHEEALNRFLEHYSANIAVHSKPYPGVIDTLKKLTAFDKAVLSNKRESLSVKLLYSLGMGGYFQYIAGSDSTSAKKPSPLAVEHVLKKLGASPESALVVGDSTYDIDAGRGAGVKTVAVTYGYRPRAMLNNADFMIDKMEELLPLIYQRNLAREKRRESRHPVPDTYRQYIDLMIRPKDGGAFERAMLLDISEHGMRIRSAERLFNPGEAYECRLSIPKSLSKEILIELLIKHVEEESGAFQAGAEIVKVDSDPWFRVFRNILEFIKERRGEVF